MAIKVYSKRGNLNYKERKYVQEIQKALEAKGITDESFEPATSFDDLQTLYHTYCVEDAEVLSITKDEPTKKAQSEPEVISNSDAEDDDNSFIDPFNDGEVIVRDYVMDDSMSQKSNEDKTKGAKSSFDEPKSFQEAFEMPDDSKPKGKTQQQQSSPPKEEKKPVNPSFDDMSTGQKKKSTKKLAKAIVFATCRLAEFGCTWWATKDITADKIAKYDIEKSIDLDLLLSMDENQQITVRNWFELQVKNANELLRVSDEGREEMTENLTIVLMEKGVALTPTQELMLSIGVHVVIDLGTKAYAMQQQIKGVLNQLIAMREEMKQQPRTEQVYQNAQPIAQQTQKQEQDNSEDDFDLEGDANENKFTNESFDNAMNSAGIDYEIEKLEKTAI
jgi:hypothetical protein